VTAILRPAESAPDPLRLPLVQLLDSALAENAILRNQLAAVVDAVVAEQMVVPRNKAEHPYTDAELAVIEADYRNHWGQIALNAAKEQQ
jgi:hypothetical protein